MSHQSPSPPAEAVKEHPTPAFGAQEGSLAAAATPSAGGSVAGRGSAAAGGSAAADSSSPGQQGAQAPLVCPACQLSAPAGMKHCTSCGQALAPDPLVGQTLDNRYEVHRRLGAGAMGAVYEVIHLRLKKRFAMKVIHRELTQIPEFVARFEREALSMSRLQHPSIVSVTDFGQCGSGEVYLVMEFLEGQPLTALLDKPLPVGQALEIAEQILLGLQHAHQAGIIHRDIKPDNVIRVERSDGSWQIKVVDFGIAKLAASEGEAQPLTQAGVVFGTPQYMAPEQALGSDVGAAADIYAVGVILWRMLTGKMLFNGPGHVEILGAKLSAPAPTLEQAAPGVFSPLLTQLVSRALERKPSERLASAEEMLAALRQIREAPEGGLAAPDGQGWLKAWVDRGAGGVASFSAQLRRWYTAPLGAAEPPSWSARLRALGQPQGKVALLTTGGLLLLGALLALLLLGDKGEDATPAEPAPLSLAQPPSKSTAPKPSEDPLKRARLLVAKKRCQEASQQLERYLETSPKAAPAHYLLGAAQICRRQYQDGLASYTRAIELNDEYAKDPQVLKDARRLLSLEKLPQLREATIAFLAERVGQPAIPLLVELASNHPSYTLRHQAIVAVNELDAEDQVDWVTSLGLDLRQTRKCGERKPVVKKLRQLEDPRAIPLLQRALNERSGLFRHRYRNGCMRKELKAAIKALKEKREGK